MSMYIPKIISKKVVYDNNWRKIEEKILLSKSGVEQSYPTMSQVGSKYCTMVFPITLEGNVIYNKEWRPGIEDFVYNFPVGMQEENLSFEENAAKELLEEVGCISQKGLRELGESIVMNFDDTIIKYFLAPECILGNNDLEDGENIEVQKCSISDFKKKISSGEINCPLTITCFYLGLSKGLI